MSSLPERLQDASEACDLEVREYMEQIDPQKHPLFSQRPICDDRTGRWVNLTDKMLLSTHPRLEKHIHIDLDHRNLKEIYAECVQAQSDLTARANRYLERSKQPPLNVDVNGDWDAVKSQMEKACAVMDKILLQKKKRPGLIGAIRRGFNALCRNAATGKALVSIIPNDLMITSAVSGGLSVIFVALEQHGIYEDSVFTALEHLPDILNTNEQYSEIAANDEEIHRLTAKLYTRVCEVLDYILRWMMDSVLLSGAKQVWKLHRYTKDLNEKMAEVKLAAQSLEKWASILLLRSQKNMFNMHGQMYSQIDHRLASLESKLDNKFVELSCKVERGNTLEQFPPMIFNNVQLVLKDDWYRIYDNNIARRTSPKRATTLSTTAEDVLDMLMFDPDLVPRDIQDILRQGTTTLQQKLQPHRLQAIQDNSLIRAWLSLDSPSLLLINGNSTSHLDLSTSFFSAKVMDTLMQQTSQQRKNIEIIPLAYFCVLHKNFSKDVAANPAELAMSLLLQLVDNHRGFQPEMLKKCLDETIPYQITSILRSLAQLLDELPPEAMVFISIDGVEHFARPDARRRGLRELCFQLIHIFREQRRAKVKLLFTSAQKAIMLENLGLIMNDEIVNIAKNPPPRG